MTFCVFLLLLKLDDSADQNRIAEVVLKNTYSLFLCNICVCVCVWILLLPIQIGVFQDVHYRKLVYAIPSLSLSSFAFFVLLIICFTGLLNMNCYSLGKGLIICRKSKFFTQLNDLRLDKSLYCVLFIANLFRKKYGWIIRKAYI